MAGVGRTSVKAICSPADGDVVVVPDSGRMGWSSLDAAIYLAGWLDLALSTIHSWLRVVEYFVIPPIYLRRLRQEYHDRPQNGGKVETSKLKVINL
jgi:hypothetical protein